MRRQGTEAGLTLIELLVCMALLGIILQAIFSMQVSTMRASTRLSGDAGRLQAIRNVGDYFTGRLRAASDFRSSLTVDSQTCDLSSSERPCFAVKVSETNPARTFFMTYQLVPRGEIRPADPAASATDPLAKDLRPDAWASTPANQVYVLVEKRWQLATGQEGKTLPTSWVSGDAMFVAGGPTSSVLADDLAPTDTSVTPNVLRFVTYDVPTRRFDVQLRLKQQEAGRTVYSPADGSFVTSTFYRRN